MRSFTKVFLLTLSSAGHLSSTKSVVPAAESIEHVFLVIQALPVVEHLDDHRYRFHDLVRAAGIDYLWHEERDFLIHANNCAAMLFYARATEQSSETSYKHQIETGASHISATALQVASRASSSSRLMADYIEFLYHYVLVAGEEYDRVFNDVATAWTNAPFFDYSSVDAALNLLVEHVSSFRLGVRTLICLRYWMGIIDIRYARMGSARRQLQECLRLMQGEWSVISRTDVLFELARAHLALGEFDNGLPLLVEALNVYRNAADFGGVERCCCCLGEVYYQTGRYEEARNFLGEALALTEINNDQYGRANAFQILASVSLCNRRPHWLTAVWRTGYLTI